MPGIKCLDSLTWTRVEAGSCYWSYPCMLGKLGCQRLFLWVKNPVRNIQHGKISRKVVNTLYFVGFQHLSGVQMHSMCACY